MFVLVPPLFPNFGWLSTGEYGNYKNVGDNQNNSFCGGVHHQENNPVVVINKVKHNARERDRRKKMNSLFSALRLCLPTSDQSKKLSIPATVSRSLEYIPKLQEQVKKLIHKKDLLLVQVPGQGYINHYVNSRPQAVASYVSTISSTRLGYNEVMVQISSSTIHKFSISNVLSGLEEDGLVLVDISSSRSQGERLFYTLHLQMGKMDDYKLNCEELSQRMLYLYEECGNTLR